MKRVRDSVGLKLISFSSAQFLSGSGFCALSSFSSFETSSNRKETRVSCFLLVCIQLSFCFHFNLKVAVIAVLSFL